MTPNQSELGTLGGVDSLVQHFQYLSRTLGFHSAPGVDLLYGDDTLLFTNSTIVGYKESLVGGTLPVPGLAIIQPCVRTQNLKAVREASFDLNYMSCFTQAGLLGGPETLMKILFFLKSYLEHFCECDLIHYKTTSIVSFNEDLAQVLTGWVAHTDTCPPDFYEWKYGLPGVRGNGVTFAVQGRDGHFRDIGNLIEIASDAGILGYEFGFGFETLLSRLSGLKSPFDVCLVNDLLRFPDDCIYRCKLLDSLMLASTLCALGVSSGTPRRGSILKRAVIDLLYLCHLCKIPITEILFAGTRFLMANGFSSHRLSDVLETHKEKIDLKLEKARRYISYAQTHNKSSIRVQHYCVDRLGIPDFYYRAIFK